MLSAIFAAFSATSLMFIASQTAISQRAPLASVAILTPAPCAKVPSNTAKKS